MYWLNDPKHPTQTIPMIVLSQSLERIPGDAMFVYVCCVYLYSWWLKHFPKSWVKWEQQPKTWLKTQQTLEKP